MPSASNHLVSVIIPTYNRAALVVEAIDSVLRQRRCLFELIVVDDGSTDATASVLTRREKELRYIRQPHRGVAAARNLGARHARGQWLAFLDSDDLWQPTKLAEQLVFHRQSGDILVSQTEEIWLRNGKRVNPCAHHRKPAGDIFVESLTRCLVSPSAVLMRRELFEWAGGFDETLTVCEDYDLWLRIANRVPIGLVPKALVIRRGGHADQLSRRLWGMDRFRVAAMLKLLATDELSTARRQAVVDELARKCAILAHGARRRQREAEAQRYMALAQMHAHV